MIFSNYAIGMFETEIPSRKFRLKKENNLHYYRTQRFLTLLCHTDEIWQVPDPIVSLECKEGANASSIADCGLISSIG